VVIAILRDDFVTNVDELKTRKKTAVLRCVNVGRFVTAGCESRCLAEPADAVRL